MVTLAYHAPYPRLLECDEPWLICVGRQIGGLLGSAGQSGSRHSMSVTCGPRDMISLVTPSLGGVTGLTRASPRGKILCKKTLLNYMRKWLKICFLVRS
jgi:hypothetical protein